MRKIIGAVLMTVALVGTAFSYEEGPRYAESASIAGTGTIVMDVGAGGRVEGFLTCVSGSVTFVALSGGVQSFPAILSGDAFITVIAGETMPFAGRVDEISITSTDGGGSDVKMVSYR